MLRGKEGALICPWMERKWGSGGRPVQRMAAGQEEAVGDRTQAPMPMEISRERSPTRYDEANPNWSVVVTG